jgi:citrate synthase
MPSAIANSQLVPVRFEAPSESVKKEKFSLRTFFPWLIEKIKSIFQAFLSCLCRKKTEEKKIEATTQSISLKKDVLFEITKDHLDTGLRGFPVGYCPTSSVDPLKGIFYAGKPITSLVAKDPVEVIYLLYHGKEGTKEEVELFSKELENRSTCSPKVIEEIEKLPRNADPMKMLCMATLLLGVHEGTGDYKEDCLNLIAKSPHIVAAVINHHAGWDKTPSPQAGLGAMENFTNMLNVPGKKAEELKRIFGLFYLLHFDHGGGNLSTFVGKSVASGLEDMYGSMASAVCALAGPRHGRANEDCLNFLQEVQKEVGENATAKDVENLVRKRLDKKQLLYGFGHAILRTEDPRATILFDFAKKFYPEDPLIKMAFLLRSEGTKVLKENPKVSSPYPNVDSISGACLAASGFNYAQYYPVLFTLSRIVGIAIQIDIERRIAREGKGTPLVRPKYIYKGRA